jgi:hypothetical protein
MATRAEAVIAANWDGIPIRVDGDRVYIRAMDIIGADNATRYLQEFVDNWEYLHLEEVWVLLPQKEQNGCQS